MRPQDIAAFEVADFYNLTCAQANEIARDEAKREALSQHQDKFMGLLHSLGKEDKPSSLPEAF